MDVLNFALLSLIFGLFYVVFCILIAKDLRKRGFKISILWLRVLIIKYAWQYYKVTLKEEGKVGYLFYLWLISINIALLFFIIYLCKII